MEYEIEAIVAEKIAIVHEFQKMIDDMRAFVTRYSKKEEKHDE